MKYSESIPDLRKQNLIKKCPVDYRAISGLIKRANKDLDTAKRNLDIDEDCSFTYAYNAMLHCGIALMNSMGYRAEVKKKHLTLVRFSGAVLKKESGSIIDMYDYMRKKRHRFIYEPFSPCSSKEAEEAIKSAEKFVKIVTDFIKNNNPEEELDF